MEYRRGFKSAAAVLAAETRAEIHIGLFDRLDVHLLARWLEIPVIDLSSLQEAAPGVLHLLEVETDVFSAVTVFSGPRRTIVHNDGHKSSRQNSNICHELSHALLHHPPMPAMDNSGCRIWNQGIEDEATWLAGCLLVPELAALQIARGRWTIPAAALRFGVSEQMIRYRVNVTGATARAQRTVRAGPRGRS
jgi:Zn-dependent peptidase ImmA (M78 family)